MTDAGLLIPFFLAPFIGSFLGVLIRRIPRGEPFAAGRSHCETCHYVLRPLDLVPILSWLFLKGRCRACGAPIAAQHTLVELAACFVPVLTLCGYSVIGILHGQQFSDVWPDPLAFLFDCILGWALLALCWIDMTCLRLPDVLTLPLLLIGFCDALSLYGVSELGLEVLEDRALGAAVGWGSLALVGWAYRRVRGRVGIGGGDAKLLAVAGAWTGLGGVPSILLLASCFGLLWAMTMMARQRRLSLTSAIPFGPPLAIATWVIRLVTQAG
ncbi:prepilin peptidase [Acetobacter sp.]|uniref:prepilin peptidase n=1 Tax=Acetobacter sp. TaxID=440 RepID=UPI0039E8A03F